MNPMQDKAYLSWKEKYQLKGFEFLVVETTEQHIDGNIKKGMEVLKKKMEKREKKEKAWLPGRPQENFFPKKPMKTWIKNQPYVRKTALSLINHFCRGMKKSLVSNPIFWTKSVKVDQMNHASEILKKAGMKDKNKIALESIVPWLEIQKMGSFSGGPDTQKMKEILGWWCWKDVQVLIIEVLFAHYGHDVEKDCSLEEDVEGEMKKEVRKKKKVQEKEDKKKETENAGETEVVRGRESGKTSISIFDEEWDDMNAEHNDNNVNMENEMMNVEEEVFDNSTNDINDTSEAQNLETTHPEEDDFSPLHPFFDDWKLLRDEESLTDYSDHMDVQVLEVNAFDDKIMVKIHDSQTWMTAKLSEEWREDLWAIKKNCILSLQKTTGGPENLLIVSYIIVIIIVAFINVVIVIVVCIIIVIVIIIFIIIFTVVIVIGIFSLSNSGAACADAPEAAGSAQGAVCRPGAPQPLLLHHQLQGRPEGAGGPAPPTGPGLVAFCCVLICKSFVSSIFCR